MTSMTANQINEVSMLLKRSFPHWKQERVKHATLAIEKIKSGNSKVLSPEERKSVEYPSDFQYITPIKFVEQSNPDKDTVVEKVMTGTALYPTTSRNFNIYSRENVLEASKTIKGAPVQADHSFKAGDTIGRVRKEVFNTETAKLGFIAGLDPKDPITEKAEAGYIRFVSVAGVSERAFCSICEEDMTFFHKHWPGEEYDGKIAKVKHEGLSVVHLGMTNYPGIKNAKIGSVESEQMDEFGGILTSTAENLGFIQERINGFNPLFTEMFYESGSYEDDTTIQYGEHNLPNDQLKEMERIRLQLEESQAKTAALEEQVNSTSQKNEKLESQYREEKITQIVEMELALNRLPDGKGDARKDELKERSSEQLQARHELLKEWYDDSATKQQVAGVAKSKQKNFQQERVEMSSQYLFEFEANILQDMLFGVSVTETAVKTVAGFDKLSERWRNPYQVLMNTARAQRTK